MIAYHSCVDAVRLLGTRKKATRGGVDTISMFNFNYMHDVGRLGVPVLTTKKINWKNIVVENLWFLSGQPTVDFLHKHGVKFWDPWTKNDGTVPSAYGNFWRRFKNHRPVNLAHVTNMTDLYQEDFPVDQVKWAIEKIKANHATRQACITSWDPRNTKDSSLPPCHVFQVLNVTTDKELGERLNLHLTQRSCDVALGMPYNMAGYGGFLLPLYARFVGLPVGCFGHTTVDTHIYVASEDGSNAEYDHMPGLLTQLKREPRPLPTIKIDDRIQSLKDIDDLVRSNASTDELLETFKLEGYDPWPAIYFKPAV